MAINITSVGRAIAALRQEKKLSQQGLARLMNVTHQAVSKWENGAALPDTQTLLALSKLFRIPMEDLLMGRSERLQDITEPNTLSDTQTPQDTPVQADALPREEAEATEDVRDMEDAPDSQQDQDEGDPLGIDELQRLLPFVSQEAADQIGRRALCRKGVDASSVGKFAPFMSDGALDECVRAICGAGEITEEAIKSLCKLGPFLSEETLDMLVREHRTAGNRELLYGLLPFLDTRTVDALALGGRRGAPEKQTDMRPHGTTPQDGQPQDKDDVRMRIARMALQRGNVDWLEEHADSLEQAQILELLTFAVQRQETELIQTLIVHVDGLCAEQASALIRSAVQQGNNELVGVILEYTDELTAGQAEELILYAAQQGDDGLMEMILEYTGEDALNELLEKAVARDDWKLIERIGEHVL